jgi:Lhr-like helicase
MGCIHSSKAQSGAAQIVPWCIWHNQPATSLHTNRHRKGEQIDCTLMSSLIGYTQTSAAALTILNELAKYRDEETGEFALDQFKIVYISPMKALVQEMVGNFTSCLTSAFGVKVGELTSDSQMTKQQISETQIIVTTPERC